MIELSRRHFLGALGLAVGAAALAGCTPTAPTAGAAGGGSAFRLPTYKAAPELDVTPFFTSETPGMESVFTETVKSYFTSVAKKPGSGGTVTTFQLTWGDPPVDMAENVYWQELNTRLGVELRPTFVPAAVFDDKFSTMLASGKIPDLVFINDQSAIQLQAIRDGAFADLSDVLSGDNILEWPNLAARQEHIWKASLKDGRIFQIPSLVWAITNPIVMRTDLLGETSVGTAPRDADGLRTALKEVSERGTGPGGQKVYGINKYESAMWRWIFRTGPDWQLDDSGSLVHVTETENYRTMLEWLAAAWQEGIFDPVAMTANEADIVSGAALQYRAVTNTFASPEGLAQNEADLPGSTWDYFDVPGFDGSGPIITRNIPYGRSTAISAEVAKDEQRLREVLGVLDYLSAPFGSEEALFVGAGIEGRHYGFDDLGYPIPTGDHGTELGVQYVGVAGGDNSYRGHPNQARWAESFSKVMENMAKNSIARPLEGLESTSKTFVSKGATLQQSWTDFERGVVTGREKPGDLDRFVAGFLSQGGEQIRSEYAQALEA